MRKPLRIAVYAIAAPATPLFMGIGAGGLAFLLATADARSVPGEFYTTCAQIFPVFLVALVVEQRIADRLGQTENARITESLEARRLYLDLPPDEWTARFAPEYVWVLHEDRAEDVSSKARRMYRRELAAQSGTVLVIVAALVAGQICAVLGAIANGTDSSSTLYLLTSSMFAASFTAIVTSAAGELFRGVVGILSS
jgi:hypothetical protein